MWVIYNSRVDKLQCQRNTGNGVHWLHLSRIEPMTSQSTPMHFGMSMYRIDAVPKSNIIYSEYVWRGRDLFRIDSHQFNNGLAGRSH